MILLPKRHYYSLPVTQTRWVGRPFLKIFYTEFYKGRLTLNKEAGVF